MDNVLCLGEETGLVNCLFDPHTADCDHGKDVGVQCYIPSESERAINTVAVLIFLLTIIFC